MHKKALKIVGVVFGIILIVAGIVVACLTTQDITDLSFCRANSYWDDGQLKEDVLVAYVVDNGYNYDEYVVSDYASEAIDMVAARKLCIIYEELNIILVAVYLSMWIFGARIIAVSLCIKTEKNDKKSKKIISHSVSASAQPETFKNTVCVNCGAPIQAGKKFCGYCGHNVQ